MKNTEKKEGILIDSLFFLLFLLIRWSLFFCFSFIELAKFKLIIIFLTSYFADFWNKLFIMLVVVFSLNFPSCFSFLIVEKLIFLLLKMFLTFRLDGKWLYLIFFFLLLLNVFLFLFYYNFYYFVIEEWKMFSCFSKWWRKWRTNDEFSLLFPF